MPIVTDIRLQKRSSVHYSVYLDNQYAFSLTDLELSASDLKVGKELTMEELGYWRAQSVESKAYSACLRYLSYRPRSQKEAWDYLMRKGFGVEVAEKTVEKLSKAGLLDDKAFA